MKAPGAVLLAPSPTDFSKFDTMYYVKGAAAGGICCSITHAALTPVDVVKTRVQLDPVKVRGLPKIVRRICLEILRIPPVRFLRCDKNVVCVCVFFLN